MCTSSQLAACHQCMPLTLQCAKPHHEVLKLLNNSKHGTIHSHVSLMSCCKACKVILSGCSAPLLRLQQCCKQASMLSLAELCVWGWGTFSALCCPWRLWNQHSCQGPFESCHLVTWSTSSGTAKALPGTLLAEAGWDTARSSVTASWVWQNLNSLTYYGCMVCPSSTLTSYQILTWTISSQILPEVLMEDAHLRLHLHPTSSYKIPFSEMI